MIFGWRGFRMAKQKKGGALAVFGLNCILFLLLIATFIFFMSIYNPHLRLFYRRITAIIVVTFTVMYMALGKSFGGYAVGKEQSQTIIFSLALRVLVTNIVAYIEFVFMSYRRNSRETILPVSEEIGMLCVVFAVQLVWIILMVILGNRVYFKINPPERCCLLTSSRDALVHVMSKLQKYRLRYKIVTVADYRDPDVKRIMAEHPAVMFHGVPANDRVQLVEYAYHLNRNIYFSAEIPDILTRYSRTTIVDDMPFMELTNDRMTLEQRVIKRAMDIVVSALGLLVLSPLMLGCALAIKFCDGGPVFYRQDRVTNDNRVFSIFKFRSMAPGVGNIHRSASVNDDRITPVGKFLRKYRLDELPQLINILRGEMSLVGPRPEMVNNVQKYLGELPEFTYRTRMKAGLTGYAQIEGKYNTSPRDKLIMDLMYIENYSLWLDIKLIIFTVRVFFKKDSTEGFMVRHFPEIENLPVEWQDEQAG